MQHRTGVTGYAARRFRYTDRPEGRGQARIWRETTIFIELVGASGVSYRFRAWPDTDPSAMAGNFVVAEPGRNGTKVLLVGVTNDLSRANAHAEDAGFAGKPLFVRLNVSRLTRYQEHEDILTQYAPPKVFDAEA